MSSPVVLMRHAEKDDEKPGVKDRDRMLTTQGKREAFSMGEKIATAAAGRPVTVWHSPVARCRQTAEQIAVGAGINNIYECPRLEGYPDFATNSRIKDIAIRQEQQRDDKRSFKHVVDQLSKNDGYAEFPRPSRGAVVFADFLFARSKEGVNINVSHDWIIHLTAHFAGVTPALFSKNRIDYLGFLSLNRDETGAVKICHRGKSGILPHTMK